MCAYVCSSERIPLYGNTPGSGTKLDTLQDLGANFINSILGSLDDHDILQDLPETEENTERLAALRRARPVFTEWRAGRFSMLSIAEKQAFLRMLKRVYCPKCLQKIDFKVEVR